VPHDAPEEPAVLTRHASPLGVGLGPAATSPSLAEFNETLKRLVDRIAKILQAEKCVFLLHDPQEGTLYATQPAQGFTPDALEALTQRVSDQGFSAEVFRTNTPVVLYDAAHDPRAQADGLEAYGVRNAVSVPLVVQKRDEDNRVLDRTTVGVLHVFNKKGGGQFGHDDVVLLQSMAVQGAAVIAQAQLYREVVQEKQELIHTIDSLYAGLLMIGTHGRLVQINPSARDILEIPPYTPLIGVPYQNAVPSERVRALLARALAHPAAELADEITVPVRDAAPEDELKQRVYQVQCAPVRGEGDTLAGIVAIFNDITEIRGVERMKTAFISTVSHELRTPLTSIKGFVSTLLADTEGFYDEATRHEFYGIIDTECDRLTRLIKDLLDISRIEQGRAMQFNMEPVNLVRLTDKVLGAQRASAKNHVLSLDFASDFPLVEADPDKMDQILTNLVNNAIKYSPHGGNIRVVGRVGDNDTVVVCVTDEGMGIPREHLPKLFERFYRVDNRDNREIGGTGIGLALVKALTESHHGTASVDSEVGKGSVFTLVLPIHQPEQQD